MEEGIFLASTKAGNDSSIILGTRTMTHKITPIQRWDEFSAYNEWVCSICNFRLIRLIGLSHEWLHGWRLVK